MKKSGYINEKWRCVNMNNQELNTELYKQLLAEQEIYRIWLMKQTPSEILRHAYEYSEGTQYMVQISQDFLYRASSEDQARLVALLPFQSFSLSMLKDRKGVFAFIDKTEDRNKSLNHVSLSDKLKVKTSRNVTAKKKEEKKIDKEI